MKKLLVFCFAIFSLSACKKDCDEVIEPCLDAKLEEFKATDEAKTIKVQNVSGQTHYWLNTDARHHDGLEYILKDNCDTACVFGGFSLPRPCESDYDWDNWETIWEK